MAGQNGGLMVSLEASSAYGLNQGRYTNSNHRQYMAPKALLLPDV